MRGHAPSLDARGLQGLAFTVVGGAPLVPADHQQDMKGGYWDVSASAPALGSD